MKLLIVVLLFGMRMCYENPVKLNPLRPRGFVACIEIKNEIQFFSITINVTTCITQEQISILGDYFIRDDTLCFYNNSVTLRPGDVLNYLTYMEDKFGMEKSGVLLKSVDGEFSFLFKK